MSIYAALFSITSIFLFVYFRRLRSINLEYSRLKRTIEDIVFSFSRDLQKIRENIQEVSEKVEAIRADALLSDIRVKLEDLTSFREKVAADVERLKGEIERLSARWSEIEGKVTSLKATEGGAGPELQENMSMKHSLSRFVGRDRALASLTATELKVLDILAREGEKTVSEIRERIGLTREHTARLMKSLYERGYVERVSNRVPYVYRLTRDMEEMIKGRE